VYTILTGSPDAGTYWRKLIQRLNAEGGQPVTFCHGSKLAQDICLKYFKKTALEVNFFNYFKHLLSGLTSISQSVWFLAGFAQLGIVLGPAFYRGVIPC